MPRDVMKFAASVIPDLATHLGKSRTSETLYLVSVLFERFGMDIAKARLAIPGIVGQVTADRAARDAELAAKKAAAEKKAASKKSRATSTE